MICNQFAIMDSTTAYEDYFSHQAGMGDVGRVYEASYIEQKGKGCCGVGRVLNSTVVAPILQRGLRALGQEGRTAALNIYRDVKKRPSLSTLQHSSATHLSEAGRNLKRRAKRVLTGRGRGDKTGGQRKKARGSKKKAPAKKRKSTAKGINRKQKPKKSQSSRQSTTASSFRDIFS